MSDRRSRRFVATLPLLWGPLERESESWGVWRLRPWRSPGTCDPQSSSSTAPILRCPSCDPTHWADGRSRERFSSTSASYPKQSRLNSNWLTDNFWQSHSLKQRCTDGHCTNVGRSDDRICWRWQLSAEITVANQSSTWYNPSVRLFCCNSLDVCWLRQLYKETEKLSILYAYIWIREVWQTDSGSRPFFNALLRICCRWRSVNSLKSYSWCSERFSKSYRSASNLQIRAWSSFTFLRKPYRHSQMVPHVCKCA